MIEHLPSTMHSGAIQRIGIICSSFLSVLGRKVGCKKLGLCKTQCQLKVIEKFPFKSRCTKSISERYLMPAAWEREKKRLIKTHSKNNDDKE